MKKNKPLALACHEFQRIGIILIAGCSFLISSCSKADLELCDTPPPESVIEHYSHNITPQQAEALAIEAMDQFLPASTRTSSRKVRSSDVVLDRSITRSESGSNATDTLFYVVNFENNGGYVVLAADSRTVDVLVISDQGNMDWQNPGNSTQEYLNNSLIEYQRLSLGSLDGDDGAGGNYWPPVSDYGYSTGEIGLTTKPTTTFEYDPWVKVTQNCIPTMLQTKWDQGYPYNARMPEIWFSGGARNFVGCTALAIAQVMAYKQHPKEIDGRKCDFEAMYDCDPKTPSEDIVSFITKIHYSFPTTSVLYFGHDGTVIHPANIQTVLQKMGYRSYRYIPGYDYAAILNSLRNKRPTTITGFELDSEMSSAHTWVIDGHLEYRRNYVRTLSSHFYNGVVKPAVITSGIEIRRYFHYNLGWKGQDDGYFYAGVFDTDNGYGDEEDLDKDPGVKSVPMYRSNGSYDFRNRIKMWVDIEP